MHGQTCGRVDNDVDYIDHSFGFSSAVEAAQAPFAPAKTEPFVTCQMELV
jgi:6-phosphofructokinase